MMTHEYGRRTAGDTIRTTTHRSAVCLIIPDGSSMFTVNKHEGRSGLADNSRAIRPFSVRQGDCAVCCINLAACCRPAKLARCLVDTNRPHHPPSLPYNGRELMKCAPSVVGQGMFIIFMLTAWAWRSVAASELRARFAWVRGLYGRQHDRQGLAWGHGLSCRSPSTRPAGDPTASRLRVTSRHCVRIARPVLPPTHPGHLHPCRCGDRQTCRPRPWRHPA